MKIQNFKSANPKKRLRQILFSAVVFLSFIKANAADYYWVGGTGNWNDFGNHWATTSGGATFHTSMPTPNDDVIFDANSFLNAGDTVVLNVAQVYCNTMDWSSVQNNPVFYSANFVNLNLFGSLFLSHDMVWNVWVVVFKSTVPGNIISTDNLTFDGNGGLVFDGIGGEWSLSDSLKSSGSDAINFFNGSFISNGNSIFNFFQINIDLNGNVSIDFSNSEITCSQWTVTNFLPLTYNVSNTRITCQYFYDNVYRDFDYHDLISNSITSFGSNFDYIYGPISGDSNTIKKYIGGGGTSFNSNHFGKAIFISSSPYIGGYNNVFDTLFFSTPGQTVTFTSGYTTIVNNLFITNSTNSNPINLSGSTSGQHATIVKSSGNVCLDNLILQDIHTGGGAAFYAGVNSVDLGNNSGWNFSGCPSLPVSDVWPGDANYDLTANNNDVLNIGLAYGETGPVRAGASNAWVAQPSTDWSSFFQSAVNKKHADCDGNGVVDNNDTLAISLNYGLTHPARLANPNSNLSISSPQIYLVANPDTVMEGDTVEVDIYLGTQAIPVDSIYGIAFTINFDTALVDTSWMPFDFTGSWMGTPGVDLLPYDHKLFSEGKADVALTRTDHINTSGYGYIGKMGAVIVDNVGTRLTTAPPYVTLPLSVSNVTALTATEFYLTISTGNENIEIDTVGTTGIHQPHNDAPFSVYPNPVRNKLNVFSYWLNGQTNCTVELYNVIGEKVISKQVPVSQNRFSIDVSTVPQDIYFIKVITGKGTVNKKIVVTKK